MSYNVAVVGATGAVGREMLQTLAERKFPAAKVYALASSKSAGRELSYGEDDVIKVCLLYTSPSPRDQRGSRMPSSA